LDGNTVKLENKYGDRLYEFDDYYIRYRDKYGPKIWYLDGRVLKRKDKYGEPVYYFEGIPDRWVLVTLLDLAGE
jgi:hypothetical protein